MKKQPKNAYSEFQKQAGASKVLRQANILLEGLHYKFHSSTLNTCENISFKIFYFYATSLMSMQRKRRR